MFATATSTKFVTNLCRVQNSGSDSNAKNELEGRLVKYEDIERTSRIVRNDMTNEQHADFTNELLQRESQKNSEIRWKTAVEK